MIDLNQLISAAINDAVKSAVDERLTEIKQEWANIIGEWATKIATLEVKLSESSPISADTLRDYFISTEAISRLTEGLDGQEWFWEKVNRFAERVVASEMHDHTMEFDHDKLGNLDDAICEQVQDLLSGATIRV